MIDRIKSWAKKQDAIRVVILTSSRAIKKRKTDKLSDFDIELYMNDMSLFTGSDEWLQEFGDIMIVMPEKREMLKTEQAIRMVIYKDGTKVDFTIANVSLLHEIKKLPSLPGWLDDGYKVLLDKDGLTKKMKKPSFKAYIPRKPNEKEFQDVINNFWFEITYVAKNLWRDEILPAKYSSDSFIRYKVLLKMLEWYVQIEGKWKCRVGVFGKGMKKMLTSSDWEKLQGTFSRGSIVENWKALYNTIAFFRKISQAVADNLGYTYPEELDKNVTKYIDSIFFDTDIQY